MNWIQQQPWFIYLFPSLAYLIGVKDYAAFTNTTDLIFQILIFTIVTLLLYFIAKKISKKNVRFILLLFYTLIVYTFFGNIKLNLAKSVPFLAHYPSLLILLGALFVILYFLFRNQKIRKFVFSYSNMLVLVLLVFQLGQFIYAKASQSDPIINPTPTKAFSDKPNLYFVLFDGYPGFEALDSLFTYDNTQHKIALEQRGYHVIDSIRSNYNYTLAAMSSLFNINYVDREQSMPVSDFSFMYKARKAINYSTIAQAFQEENYKINNLSIFPFANQKGVADYIGYLTPLQIANKYFFHNYLLNDLAKNDKYKYLPIVSLYEKPLDRYYYQNKRIFTDCIASINPSEPTFTYAHLLLPHEPYLTDSAGNLWKDLSAIPEQEAFLQYTKYASKLMLDLADAIEQKDSNAAVLFLSDHGYRGLTGEDKKYSYHNFLALKTPDNKYDQIENVKSNIHVFPYLLNNYYGQDIEYKKDSTFYIFYTKNVFETL